MTWYYVPDKEPNVTDTDITELSLYTGNSGFGLLARLLFPDVRTVCYLDHEAHQAATIVARIRDKALDDAPVASRIESFRGRPWRGCVDLLTASMPCTPHSQAGPQKDIEDPRWLWRPTRRIINQVRPRAIFMENVLGFKRVLPIVRPQLEALGYTVDVCFVSAAQVGATHRRLRTWLLAYSNSNPPRLEPWWRRREGRAGAPEHRRRHHALGDPGRVGQREPNPEACSLARGDARRADLFPVHPMGDAHGVERGCRSGRSAHVEAPGWAGSRHAGQTMGNPAGSDLGREGQSGPGQVPHRGPGRGLGHADGAGLSKWQGQCPYPRDELAAVERAVAQMGYPYGGRQPRLEECYGQQTDADREASHWRNSFGPGIPLFPPGRSEGERREWAEILERDLGLCPALPKSEIRGVVDGTSGYVDQCRSVGRGLVPLAGAYAMLSMFVRAGLVG